MKRLPFIVGIFRMHRKVPGFLFYCLLFVCFSWGNSVSAKQDPVRRAVASSPKAKSSGAKKTTVGKVVSKVSPSKREAVKKPASAKKAPVKPKSKKNKLSAFYQGLKVRLVTLDEGDWLFTYFGHNAILPYHPKVKNYDDAYNFGMFSVSNVMGLVHNFLQNTLQYSLDRIREAELINDYKEEDRTYREREILLTVEERRRLLKFLLNHYRPKNRNYHYNHYTSNCSTKIRDALLAAIGPTFRQNAQEKRGWTYRRHIMRKLYPNPVVMVLIDMATGPYADRELTLWEEMFLPDVLENYLASPIWKKQRGRSLVLAPKLRHKRTKAKAWFWHSHRILYGLMLLCLLLGVLVFRKPVFRTLLRLMVFFLATLGCVLFFLVFFTKIPEFSQNANLLVFHPLHWAFWWMLSKKRWHTEKGQVLIKRYLLVHIGLGILYMLLNMSGVVPYQANTHFMLFALGIFGLATYRLLRVPPQIQTEEVNQIA